jgi:opacity protein-like surface antigen
MNGHKIKIALASLAGFLTLTAGSRVHAEDLQDRHLTIGPRAQYFAPKDGDDNWSGGAQVRYFFSQAFAIEGSADYRREKYGDTRVDVVPLQASLLAYIVQPKPFGVFLLGGAGWYYRRINPPAPAEHDTDDRLGLHAGGGVEYRISNSWSLDGTYRYVWIDSLKTKDSALQDKELDEKGQMVTIGLNYNF